MHAVVEFLMCIKGAHEGPQAPTVREEDAMAHRDIALACIHDHGRPPSLAPIVAHLHMSFLGGRIFVALVVTIGGV